MLELNNFITADIKLIDWLLLTYRPEGNNLCMFKTRTTKGSSEMKVEKFSLQLENEVRLDGQFGLAKCHVWTSQ